MTTFAILLGGTLTITDRLSSAVKGARIIAADSGITHATALGVEPELWVGDFDSASTTLMDQWVHVEREPYLPVKAVTDGEIAVSAAILRGASSLIFIGGLGGERFDHALMHLFQAVSLCQNGYDVMLTSGLEEAWPLCERPLTLDLPKDSLFSIMAMTRLEGLTIANARYPLTGFEVAFGSSRTLSNVANGTVTLSLQSGKAIVIARPNDFSGV